MKYKAVHQPMDKRFIVPLEDDHKAVVSYEMQGDILKLVHSEVPEELRGKGYGSVMMEAVLKAIEQEGYKIVPVCSYVKHYISKHDEWQHLAA
ncbi:GNAT family N-acetyltransferase [Kangiella sediminilitoris]|uniref:Acetyltransferase n=1 Tax=Kangiella sediminilitoris TaxID=1144748 RepID=A0A1B3BD01_9GAMM|nr:GNAT family N-acetyltransferase [Kangiella sediminilitoris]AOE50696.1 acetyltransferase [Kangiella sediminilitoris]